MILKLPQLLSQYLYLNKKLDLPGIGSFTLDSDAVIPQESDRMGQVPATGIHFRNVNVQTADEKLVGFIKEHTGKMKSLAAADLDFFLTTGRQLLNIGKPFYLDGIGTLIKNKEGYFEFTQGEYLVMRLEEAAPERRAVYEEPPRDREPKGGGVKQGMLLALIIFGAVVIAWGGYYLYKKNSFSEPSEKRAVVASDTSSQIDSSHTSAAIADTSGNGAGATGTAASTQPKASPAPSGLATSTQAASSPATSSPAASSGASAAQSGAEPVAQPGETLYRFVILETDNKHHALRRYNQLLGYQLNIKMEQKDSSFFKLYFPIATRPRDTTYIKDSLSDTYAAPRVTIEQ